MEFENKKVLLIGSGSDIDGRAMQNEIDNESTYDLVARVNKPYGWISDCGLRTDIFFIRRRIYKNMYCIGHCILHERTLNRPVGRFISMDSDELSNYAVTSAQELGMKRCSMGLLSAKWLKEQGADVTVIGFGFKDGAFLSQKKYASGLTPGQGQADLNAHYDWNAENDWLKENVHLI